MEDSGTINKNFCRCGCGQEIEILNCRKQLKKYVKGHNVVNFVKHGADHPSWKGGKLLDKNGYFLIHDPKHPRSKKRNSYVLEHILIMESYLGRRLKDNEIVHHKNQIKTDNRIENLQLMTDSQHKSLHTLEMWREGKYNNRYSKER